ncbi:MAG: glycosyltransferase family 2 protein [Clostridiales bacterium]|nr:glycosyltransferase family 2 protein [Clostridiales bacterium]
MADLTAIVLTKNEGKNIVACLESIQDFAKRVVVIDSGSTDDTVELAKALGADVYYNEFKYYAQQFNWGIDNTDISTKWVLRLDADERFTPELCREAESLMKRHDEDDVNGLTMEAWLYFLGKRLKYGLSKKRKLMIFKYGLGRIEDRKRDAHTILISGKSVFLKERFLHYDFKDITSFISKYNFYAIREFEDYLDFKESGSSQDIMTDKRIRQQRRKKFGLYYRAPRFLRAWLWFVYNYYLRLGFLDGKEGFLFHYFECYWYRMLVDAKIFEYLNRDGELGESTSHE